MKAVSQLMAALGSRDAQQRLEAVEALVLLGAEANEAAAALVRAAGDEDDAVRDQAQAALEDLGPPPREALGSLVELLGSPTADVAYWAATLLGRLGPEAREAAEPLAAALAEHAGLNVRQRAAWALGQIRGGGPRVQSALTAAAAGSDKRLARLASDALEAILKPEN